LDSVRQDAPQRRNDLREVFNILRWVVERSFAWLTGSRRLAVDDERLPETVARLHLVAFARLMLGRMVKLLLGQSV
jgi:transposase